MPDDEYLDYLIGLVNEKLDMFDSLADECDFYWKEIRDGCFEWQGWRDEAACLVEITKEEVIEAYDKWLNPDQDHRRQVLALQVIGTGRGAVSRARPKVEGELGDYIDAQVRAFRDRCKDQIWGRVNSKLF